MEGLDKSVVEKFWDDNLNNIYNPDWRPGDGESFNDILRRLKMLKQLLLSHDEDDTIGIVSHSAFLRHFIGYSLMDKNYNPFIFSNLLRHILLDNLGYILVDVNKEKDTISIIRWHNWEKFENASL